MLNFPLFKSIPVPVLAVVMLIISSGLFLTIGVTGDWEFALALRSKKLLTLMVVGFAIGTSTLLFQTLTHNPILTPSLLGFDSLYVLINSLLVFFLGVVGFANLSEMAKFGIKVGLMLSMSLLLFRLLFSKTNQDLTRLILVGVVLGVLFRSLSALIARLMNPDSYVVVQSASFAQFNTVNSQLLWVSMAICAGCAVWLWRLRYACDVLLLGKNLAINLGVGYRSLGLQLLCIIAILVSVSTALVGPVTFLGLLVCALTNQMSKSMYHSERLVLVALIAMLCLIVGQLLFEQVFGMAGVLSVVIELVGGLVFLMLVFHLYAKKTVV